MHAMLMAHAMMAIMQAMLAVTHAMPAATHALGSRRSMQSGRGARGQAGTARRWRECSSRPSHLANSSGAGRDGGLPPAITNQSINQPTNQPINQSIKAGMVPLLLPHRCQSQLLRGKGLNPAATRVWIS